MPSKGEVWSVRFDPAEGAEIRKTRPAVVVSSNTIGRLPLRTVVPITEWKPSYANYSWLVRLVPNSENGLTKESGADAFQIKSISVERFVERLGELNAPDLQRVIDAVKLCLDG